MKIKKVFFLLVSAILLSVPSKVFCMNSIGIMTGYLFAPLKHKQNYKTIPLYISLNFDYRSLFPHARKIKKGVVIFSIEPFINTVYSPDANIETGVNFLVRYNFFTGKKIKLYIKGGLGVLYMSQHTREQSTQYNFLPQIGPGISYFLNKHTSLDLEYRFRHLSNASLKRPNGGINANVFLCGMTHHF